MFRSSITFFTSAHSSSKVRGKSAVAVVWSVLHARLVRLSAGVTIAGERKALRELSDSQLLDMGITRADADREAKKHYFDIPSERLRMYGQLDCGADMTTPINPD